MRNVVRSLVSLLVLLTAAASTAGPSTKSAPPPKAISERSLPKLVLQITIDQLRGDLPLRYQDRFAAGGFRYLLERGTWYSAAHHPHSYTETIVGHTTLATGAYPSRHGMVANNWYDRASQQVVPDSPLLFLRESILFSTSVKYRFTSLSRKIEGAAAMIALFSRWKLKDGCPPELAAALEELAARVKRGEPGTLLYSVSLPAPHPPIGPPPDYAVSYDPGLPTNGHGNELVFFEVYRDAEAFSEHLRGPFSEFLDGNRDHFVTPWLGHPRPETTYLDPHSIFVRSALGGAD